jgi:hypothetical protein
MGDRAAVHLAVALSGKTDLQGIFSAEGFLFL